MSPEVCFGEPYNQKADVYSFGVLLYEVTSLIEPFEGYTLHEHEVEAMQQGKRPCLRGYSPVVSGLIEDCWRHRPEHRPDMDAVLERLDGCIASLEGEDAESALAKPGGGILSRLGGLGIAPSIRNRLRQGRDQKADADGPRGGAARGA